MSLKKRAEIRPDSRLGRAAGAPKRPHRMRTAFVAALALVAALTGSALAGSGPNAVPAGKADQALKNAKQAKKSAKKATKVAAAVNGQRGPQGEQGGTGPAGPKGQPGDPPAASASFYSSSIGSLPAAPGLVFGAVSGTSSSDTTEADVVMLSPNTEIKVSDLSVVITQQPGDSGDSYTFVVRGSPANTAVECTITDQETACDSSGLGLTDTIPAATPLSIGITGAGSPDGAAASIGFTATTQ